MVLEMVVSLWYLQPSLPTASQWYSISTGIVLRIWKGHYGWGGHDAFSAKGGSKHGKEQRGPLTFQHQVQGWRMWTGPWGWASQAKTGMG